MLSARSRFLFNIERASELGALYDYLVNHVPIPNAFDDLLRSQLVYALSAFDKLVHDLIRIGMVQTFQGLRHATEKYNNEGIQLKHISMFSTVSTPPPAIVLEQIFRDKLSILSFQDPKKLADGLSYIWSEPQKWSVLAAAMGMQEATARTTLRLIATRRNAIVHEADMDPLIDKKQEITRFETEESTLFLRRLGIEVCTAVITS